MKKSFLITAAVLLGFSGKALSSEGPIFPDMSPSAGVRALAGSGAALGGEHISPLINPASAAELTYSRFSIFYGNTSPDTHMAHTEYIYPFSRRGSLSGGVGAGYRGTSEHMQNYLLSLSLRVFRWLSAGGTARAVAVTSSGERGEAFAADAGLMLTPVSWLKAGAAAYNLNTPVLEFPDSSLGDMPLTPRLRAGISLFSSRFLNITGEVSIEDFMEDFRDAERFYSAGIEIFPDPALALRGGVREDEWSAGLGILSERMNFAYAFVSGEDDNTHYFQYSRKFGVSPSRREEELEEKEKELEREARYLEAVRLFNLEDIRGALGAVDKYRERYGADRRITELEEDIREWKERARILNLGRASEMKKEILREYYAGRIRQARVKLENAKLLAPYYEELWYLDHLIKARELLEEGEYLEAESHLVEALKLNPDSRDVLSLYRRIQEVIDLGEE